MASVGPSQIDLARLEKRTSFEDAIGHPCGNYRAFLEKNGIFRLAGPRSEGRAGRALRGTPP